MKKSILYSSIILLILASIISCTVEKYEKVDSYIMAFYQVSDLKLEITENNAIRIQVDPLHQYTYSSENEEDKALYKLLCKQHNDEGYNKELNENEIYLDIERHCYSQYPITHIELTSNKDYNQAHLAGKSLNDIIKFVSVSPCKFIQNGYKGTYNWNANNLPIEIKKIYGYAEDNDNSNTPIVARLDKVDFTNNPLLGVGTAFIGHLYFEEQPTTKGVHEFTVTLTLENGKSYSQTIEKTFE